jgi:hypothetical protein
MSGRRNVAGLGVAVGWHDAAGLGVTVGAPGGGR